MAAAEARAEFLAALTAFLGLVGLERQARGSPTEALEEASRISGAWPFRMIHAELLRAELAGQQPWDGLRDLGRRVGVEQLAALKAAKHLPLMGRGTKTERFFVRFGVKTDKLSVIVRGHGDEVAKRLFGF